MQIGLQHATPESAVIAGKPPVQRKIRLGPVDDPLEHEADRIANQVVSDIPVNAISSGARGVQRKCAACEAEEESTVRRKAAGPAAGTGADGVAAGISHNGAPLGPTERAYFEPRFGSDFSAVRVHTDDQAATAAAGISARAFTLGHDIAFARDEYKPATDAGRRLIAHELAHTLQQNGTSQPVIRRASYGNGAPPAWGNTTLAVVPQDERPRVDEAMRIIDEVVAGTGSFSECHDLFAKNCPGGTSGTLASVWQRAVIWRDTNAAATENGSARTSGSNIVYTATGYNQGAEGLAGTLLHESGHNCGIPGGNTHWRAAQIRSYCIGPGRNSISIGVGGYLGGDMPIVMVSYRRLLGDLASGRLRFTLGADLNTVGTIAGIAERNTPSAFRTTGEIGSGMVGGQVRLGGWGGSRYGGFGLRLETGLGAGTFSMRRATAAEDPSTTTGAGWVLQVGPRAEFLVKSGDAHVFDFTLSAAYRMMQPLNTEARALHAFVGAVEFHF